MNIYVLNQNAAIIGIISEYQSIIWDMQLYNLGYFELVIAGSPEHIDLLRENLMLVREKDIDGAKKSNVMIIEKVVTSFDAEKGYILTVTGRSLKAILNRRIIWEQISVEDTAAATVIYKVLHDNALEPEDTDREIPNLNAGAPEFQTNHVTLQAFGEPIGDWMAALCEEQKLGWDINLYNSSLMVTLIQGTNRTTSQTDNPPVVFSADFDNLISATVTRDITTFHNVALVGGEGEGTAQRVASVGSGSGLDRYEMYVDGSDVSSNGEIITLATYLEMLEQAGAEELAKAEVTKTFDSQIDTDGVYKIGQDFDLGDYVTVIDNRIGVTADTRLIEIIESEDQNGHTVLGTFSGMEA